MLNKFKVKKEMFSMLSDYFDELDSRLNDYVEELNEAQAKAEDERDYWDTLRINEHPARIEAIKQIKTHMEKLL